MGIKVFVKLAVLAASVGLASSAWASVSLSEVGSHDAKLASTYLASAGDSAEQGWLDGLSTSILPDGYVLTGRYQPLSEGLWQAVDGVSGGWAAYFGGLTCDTTGDIPYIGDCGTAPDYYVLRLGTGGSPTGTNNYFLFQNLDAMDWAFVNLSDFPGVSSWNIGRVSHISVGNEGSVPEPATLVLLGLGALGLGFSRRRKQA